MREDNTLVNDLFSLKSCLSMRDIQFILGVGSPQRVNTLVEKLALRPVGGGGPGNHLLFSLLDAICGHYAVAWTDGVESVPLARELGFNAGRLLQDMGWHRVMEQIDKGNTLVLPLFKPAQVGGPDWRPPMVPPGSRYASNDPGVDGELVNSPDLRKSLFAVTLKIHEIAARPRKPKARTYWPPSELTARALAELRTMLAKTAEVKAGE